MKFSLALIAVAAGFVAAQNFEGQPSCAIPCLEAAIPSVGCAIADTGCQCDPGKQNDLVPFVVPCLLSRCTNPTDLGKAQTAAAAACSTYFATATLSSGPVTSSTPRSTGSGTTPTGSSPSTTGAPTTTSAPTTGPVGPASTRTSSTPAAAPTGPAAMAGLAVAAFLGAVALV